jgi:hypothetical protein
MTNPGDFFHFSETMAAYGQDGLNLRVGTSTLEAQLIITVEKVRDAQVFL